MSHLIFVFEPLADSGPSWPADSNSIDNSSKRSTNPFFAARSVPVCCTKLTWQTVYHCWPYRIDRIWHVCQSCNRGWQPTQYIGAVRLLAPRNLKFGPLRNGLSDVVVAFYVHRWNQRSEKVQDLSISPKDRVGHCLWRLFSKRFLIQICPARQSEGEFDRILSI